MVRSGTATLLFDLDGTLTDPKAGIVNCIVHALHALGIDVPHPDTLTGFIGPPLLDSFAVLLGGDRTEAARAVQLYRERYATLGLFENAVYDGIPEVLRALREAPSRRMFVATSKPREFAEPIMTRFGLRGYFEGIYGSELDGTRTDKGHLLRHLLDTERIDPAQATMIGDRAYDILGAKSCGLRSVGVLWGYGSRAELESAGAQGLCGLPADLLSWIG